MTKEELKSALISHGAPVPPSNAKKDEFIQAYVEHVAPLEAGEFSSDEEAVAASPGARASNISRTKVSSSSKLSTSSRRSVGSPRKAPQAAELEESRDIEMTVDVAALDDSQLFEMLGKAGVEAGPIVASTRKFYEKRLAAALAGEGAAATNGANGTKEFSDTEPEEEEEEEEQPAVEVVQRKTKTPRSSKSSISSPPADSALRQRLVAAEEVDSPASPGARRSIHSYKVTEVTRQVTTRARDGTETTDTRHTVERSERAGEAAGRSWTSLLYPLLKLAILATLLVGLYLVFTTPSAGVTPIDKVAEIINNAMPPAEAGAKVEEVVEEVPVTVEEVVEPAPDASNIVDV